MDDVIRILVADDHTLIRRGIVGPLVEQPDMEVVGEAGDGLEAIALTAETSPDILLLDVAMPGLNGIEVTRRVSREQPEVRILILTMHDREDYFFKALQAGASGYIMKGSDVQDLLAAVRAVHAGEVYLFPTVTKKLLADYLRHVEAGSAVDTYDGLTDREREVLSMIASGMTGPQIAEELHLSPHTIRTHRDHIMEKLGLHSRTELVKYAIRTGLLTLDD